MIRLSDDKPIHGDMVAVIDESSPAAGPGVYYIVTAAVIFNPCVVQDRIASVVGERKSPFHYRREGPAALERMATALEELEVMASVLWRPAGRRGQVAARRGLLTAHARQVADDGITHLIIESGNATSDRRDQDTLLDAFAGSGQIPYPYDWRSKTEPLLWVADFVCGVTAQHLLGGGNSHFDRLASAGIIDVRNV